MQALDIAQSSCGRCRDRRVKCDRRKPACQRCQKYSQPCPGYERKRPFRDEGPGLYKKFSRNGSSYRCSVTLSQPAETHTEASPPTTIPQIVDPPTAGTSDGNVLSDARSEFTSTGEAQDSITDDDRFFDLDPAVYYTHEDNPCGADSSVPQCAPELQPTTPSEVELPSPNNSEENPTPEFAEEDFRENRLQALLIRRFVEVISPWLDVFDTEKYFGYVVPIRACHSSLLRDSLAAVAAKQLGNLDQDKEVQRNRDSTTRPVPLDPDVTLSVDWSFEAASFYDRAIRSMIKALQSIANPMPTDTLVGIHPDQWEGIGDLLAAMSILLVYELMDNHHLSMVQHLAGAHHLLGLVLQQQEARTPDDTVWPPLPEPSLQRIWKASFWNFVCFDYVTSYEGQSKPKLGRTDARLWQASGLPLTQVGGQFVPVSLVRDNRSSSPKMTETVACRTLLWILLRVLDCIVVDGQTSEGRQANRRAHQRCGPSCPSSMRVASWAQVDQYLMDWYAALPDTFEPCLRASQPYGEPTAHNGMLGFPMLSGHNLRIPVQGLFIANPMGATALPLYHFSRILFLLHSPLTDERSNPSTGASRLRIYRQLSRQVKHHAVEICSVAAGQPPPATQMHLIQPLHLAGLCLNSEDQRSMLEELLLGLQHRTGFSTARVLQQLKEGWCEECIDSNRNEAPV